MTAKQRQARARFKKVVQEATKLRKKNKKLTQAQAVKQAWAIQYSKEGKSKKVGNSKVKKDEYLNPIFNPYMPDVDYSARIKKAAKKVIQKKSSVKAKRSKKGGEMHTDTKSHNVNIKVVSGINKLNGLFDISIINDIDALKKEYYKLAKKYHPDAGGTKEQFQNLQKEYEDLLNKLLRGSKLSEEQKANEIILDEAIREIINNIIYLEGISVEVIGKWLWIGAASGYNFDTPTYNALKNAGLSYIKKAGRPFMVYRGIESKSRGNLSMEEIRKKYGSAKFEAGKGRLISGIKKVNKSKLKAAIKKAIKALDKRPI